MNASNRKMIGNGAVITFIGLLAGFGLVMSMIGGFEVFPGSILHFSMPGDPSTWARTHVGGIMNGLMVILFAVFIHSADLPQRMAWHLRWMVTGAGYANTVFYWAALFAPNHAVTFGSSRLGHWNLAGVIGFAPALIFAIVLLIAMIMIMRWAFSSKVRS